MVRLKQGLRTIAYVAAFTLATMTMAQAQTAPAPAAPASPAKTTPAAPPLKLHSLTSDTVADPFPPTNPKFFTADSPTVATVDSYLHTMLGYDPNRLWRVAAIQKTAAPGVSKVTALISEKTANAKVQSATFFVMPDGKHLVADSSGVLPFGTTPYADYRALLQAHADGPYQGSASKDLMLVEFSDLQCPHCKDAQATMKRLVADFPKARIVYQNLPLTEIHPMAEKAALDGICVANKSNDAFFTYAQAVYDTQAQLTPEAADDTLNAAITKAGADPAAVATCAAGSAAKSQLAASLGLAAQLGVEQTPLLLVNGRSLPLGGIPYETLKQIIIFQASIDGVPAAAATAPLILPTQK